MKPYRVFAIWLLCLAGLAFLAACSAGGAQNPGAGTLVPTVAIQEATAAPGGEQQPGGLNGYPAPGENGAQPNTLGGAYPAPGDDAPPQGVPAVDNRATVTAKLISQTPSDANPAQTRLHVQVLTSTDVEGMQNMTKELVEKEADLVIDSALLPADLQIGDTFEATVSYRGDENGGMYLVENLTKTAQ